MYFCRHNYAHIYQTLYTLPLGNSSKLQHNLHGRLVNSWISSHPRIPWKWKCNCRRVSFLRLITCGQQILLPKKKEEKKKNHPTKQPYNTSCIHENGPHHTRGDSFTGKHFQTWPTAFGTSNAAKMLSSQQIFLKLLNLHLSNKQNHTVTALYVPEVRGMKSIKSLWPCGLQFLKEEAEGKWPGR